MTATDLAEDLKIEIALPERPAHSTPVEPLWRELNYALSRVFVGDTVQSLIQNMFDRLSTKVGYAHDWIDTVLPDSGRVRQ